MATNDKPAAFELPSDLAGLSAEDLAALQETARGEFNGIYDFEGGPQAEHLERAGVLADALDALSTEDTRRKEESASMKAKFDEYAARVNKPSEAESDQEPTDGGPVLEGEIVEQPAAPTPAAAPAPQLATVTASSTRTAPRELGGLAGERAPKINPSLADARRMVPAANTPAKQPLALTASFDLPGRGLQAGQRINDLATLADLVEERARALPTLKSRRRPGQAYGGLSVARLQNSFEDVFDLQSSPDVVEKYKAKLTGKSARPQAMAALTAAGGWCAPSEIRYDFFNVACSGGKIDLPTFGVNRGGLRWPVSPSVMDAYSPDLAVFEGVFSNATVPWLWTETNDVVAATGTLTKPCIRVPCATMSESRLECYGVCVTAGNLADSAWPEATRNFLQLLDAVYGHAINSRHISTIQSLTTNIGTVSATGLGVASPLLDMVELAAWDYRERLGMCPDDVLEVILPAWAVGPIRQDLARRTGMAEFNVTDAMIMQWFTVRGVRVQLVDDYQVRSAGQPGYSTAQTSWPATVEFMIYAPGTFGLGNGMSLDLGVVRDSTLNALNDHTAAWYEECHMISMFGHLARRYTVNICGNGTTGAANITTCTP